MRIVSFDIGIKNLSYAVGDYDENTRELKIEEWDIINILEDEINAQQLCSHIGTNKNKIKCKKFANFKIANGEEFFCKTHKKNHKKYVPPNITKLKDSEERISCQDCECNKKAKYMVNFKQLCPSHKSKIEKYYKTNFTLKKVKTIKCNKYPINKIADKMITVMDEKYIHLLNCDIVLIELQPAMTAMTMKTVSNYLSMWFRIRGKHDKINGSNIQEIKYYRATNKLEFNKDNTNENKNTYTDRKKTGIDNVNEYLDYKNDIENKEKFNSHKKRDDMSDALLQILSYLQANKML